MKVAGIIAEYNPFHRGHAYHIRRTRERLGEDAGVVCVMSGNFVQRGQAAALDKWARAECALRGGADLVLELPTVFAASSAERFARGAVDILAATGVADTLSFGCEGALPDLEETARALLTAEYREALRREAVRGVPFAAVRQKAAAAVAGRAADCLAMPNNNLAVEYLKALHTRNAPMEPMAVPRRGALHDAAEPQGDSASASAIRALMEEGRWDEAAAYLPGGTAEVLARERLMDTAPAALERCERAVLSRLRAMGEADFAALPDAGAPEGLPRRMLDAAWNGVTLEEVYALAKTRRYALSRIRRMVLWAFLGLTAADRPERPAYLRVLGMNGRGKAILREMGRSATLPVLTKAAHVKRLDEDARRLFSLEARCTDLYALCRPACRPCGQEWTRSPVVLEGQAGVR